MARTVLMRAHAEYADRRRGDARRSEGVARPTVVPNDMIVAVSRRLRRRDDGSRRCARHSSRCRRARPCSRRRSTSRARQPGVYFVDKNDVNQSNVFIVGLGTERSNPDYYALTVMNEIFSGGFGSRLFQNVRTKLGLAYSVGGSYGAPYDHPGMFRVVRRDQERQHGRGDQGDAG